MMEEDFATTSQASLLGTDSGNDHAGDLITIGTDTQEQSTDATKTFHSHAPERKASEDASQASREAPNQSQDSPENDRLASSSTSSARDNDISSSLSSTQTSSSKSATSRGFAPATKAEPASTPHHALSKLADESLSTPSCADYSIDISSSSSASAAPSAHGTSTGKRKRRAEDGTCSPPPLPLKAGKKHYTEKLGRQAYQAATSAGSGEIDADHVLEYTAPSVSKLTAEDAQTIKELAIGHNDPPEKALREVAKEWYRQKYALDDKPFPPEAEGKRYFQLSRNGKKILSYSNVSRKYEDKKRHTENRIVGDFCFMDTAREISFERDVREMVPPDPDFIDMPLDSVGCSSA